MGRPEAQPSLMRPPVARGIERLKLNLIQLKAHFKQQQQHYISLAKS